MIALLLAGWLLAPSDTAPQSARLAETEELAVRIKGADLDLLDEVRRIAGNVELLRGQSFARKPLAVRVSDDMRQVAGVIRAGKVLPRNRIEARGRAWESIGFAPAPAPRELLEVLASDLRGIGFDAEGNRLLVAPDRLTTQDFVPDPKTEAHEDPSTVLLMTGVRRDEPLVSHLLIHVRQRERLGRDPLEPTTDRLLAAMAWSEGEANLVAVRYLFQGMDAGLADEVLDRGLDPGQLLGGSLLPPDVDARYDTIGDLLRFVYREGFARATEAFRAGGWEALDGAMRDRGTTQTLLHPDQVPAEPLAIDPPEPPPGMTLVDEDSLGEQAIVVLVSRLTGKDNLGLIAGDGWNGDRLFRWEAEGATSGVTEWVTRWVDESNAEDFEYALRRSMAVLLGEPTAGVFTAGDETTVVERRANQVRVRVSPAPDAPAPSQTPD